MANFLSPPALAGQTNTLQNAQNLFNISPEELAEIEAFKKAGITPGELSEYRLNQAALDLVRQKSDPNKQKQDLEMYGEYYKKMGEEAQRLGKESLAYTSMMNQINNLPGTIASAFGGAGERQLTQEMYGKIPGIVAETYRSFPRTQIQPVGYSVPGTRYFS